MGDGGGEGLGILIYLVIIAIAIIILILVILTIGSIIGALFGGGTALSNYYKSFRSNVAVR